ncbi:MAG: hypothetical protein HY664_08610 [Chloroflexi bacterium]|nr:hypothetical protein [Chloroflexota bacterium]
MTNPGPQSMRYSVDEVLSGMLASITRDDFTDDIERLGALFKGLSQAYPLLAPYAAIAGETDFSAVLRDALQKLADKKWLRHEPGRYFLTKEGRAACVGSKRVIFNASDIEQLEAAARYLDAQVGT